MIKCKCLKKYYDKNGIIIGYLIMDSNGRTVEVKKDVLKSWIQTGKVEVVNLTLSQDGRLVDAAKPKEKVESKKYIWGIEDNYINEAERKKNEYRQKKEKLERILINILCAILLDENGTVSIIQNSLVFRWRKADRIQFMRADGQSYDSELVEKYRKAFAIYEKLLKENNGNKTQATNIYSGIEYILTEKKDQHLYEMIKPTGLIKGPVKYYQRVSCNRQLILDSFTYELEDLLEECMYDLMDNIFKKKGTDVKEYEVLSMLNARKVIELFKRHGKGGIPKVKGIDINHEDLMQCADNALKNLIKRYT